MKLRSAHFQLSFKQSFQKLHTVFLLKSHGPEFSHRGTPSYKACWEIGLINASLTHTDTKVYTHTHTKVHMHTYISVTKERTKECELPAGRGTASYSPSTWHTAGAQQWLGDAFPPETNTQERKSFSLSLFTLFLYLYLNLHCICQSLHKSRLISQTSIAF